MSSNQDQAATDPLVSVVIPNHNYARYVPEAIDSVLAQTYRNVEVIVVDNGSTDDSLEVLDRYRDRCRIVAQRDLGQSGGRNRGIHEASGDWIAFLDADDVWLPGKLEAQFGLVAAGSEDLGLVYCSMQTVDADLRPIAVLPARFRGRVLDAFVRHPGWAIVLGGESTALVRRETIVRAGSFDPSLSIGAGWDLWRRIATLYEVDFVAEPLVLYRQHGTNLHGRLDAYERDLRYMSTKMFADPIAAPIVGRHRSSYLAGVDIMLAKSFSRSGSQTHAARLLTRALLRDPRALLAPSNQTQA